MKNMVLFTIPKEVLDSLLEGNLSGEHTDKFGNTLLWWYEEEFEFLKFQLNKNG